MRLRKLQHPLEDKSEGDCCGFPYATELASINGVSIHFWVGDGPADMDALQRALNRARGHRDIVSASWSAGHPTGYWAHNDIKKEA